METPFYFAPSRRFLTNNFAFMKDIGIVFLLLIIQSFPEVAAKFLYGKPPTMSFNLRLIRPYMDPSLLKTSMFVYVILIIRMN